MTRALAAAGWFLLATGVAIASLTITLALCRAASGDPTDQEHP